MNKKLITAILVIIGLAILSNSLNGKLVHEKSLTEALKKQVIKMRTNSRTSVEIRRIPFTDGSGNLALDGEGRPVFTEETFTRSESATESETRTEEATRTETEREEKSAYTRQAMVFWNPLRQTEIGLMYSQRLLGPVTLGVMGRVDLSRIIQDANDLINPPYAGYIMAGISF